MLDGSSYGLLRAASYVYFVLADEGRERRTEEEAREVENPVRQIMECAAAIGLAEATSR